MTSTLVLTSKGADFFDCPPLGPFHIAYALKAGNDFHFGGRGWRVGDCVISKGFNTKVLELSREGIPRSVAFHFEQSLDSDNMVGTTSIGDNARTCLSACPKPAKPANSSAQSVGASKPHSDESSSVDSL